MNLSIRIVVMLLLIAIPGCQQRTDANPNSPAISPPPDLSDINVEQRGVPKPMPRN